MNFRLMAVITLVSLLLTGSLAQAASVTAQGIAPKNTVMLVFDPSASQDNKFFRVHSNAKQEAGNFQVPNNNVLVVTDVNLRVLGGPASTVVDLILTTKSNSTDDSSRVAVVPVKLDANGNGAAREDMTQGFLIGQGVHIEARLDNNGAAITDKIDFLTLRGYLVNTKTPAPPAPAP